MEPLKHECGVALIRLRRPLSHYREKYGTYSYGLDKLYLMMEKQHNRGQEAAGVGVVKLDAPAGYEQIFRERALGKDAIPEIFSRIGAQIPADLDAMDAAEVNRFTPFIGQVYMGHLRYSTTGRSGIKYAHPVLRRNNWRSRSLMLCGNFNMTNVDEMFARVVASGQHPRMYSDTNMLLEQLGFALDKENHRLYRQYRDTMHDPLLAQTIEREIDLARVLRSVSPEWDGGYVMCGVTGATDMFALRDPHGIRPAFYYWDDEVVVLASERPVLQTTFDLREEQVRELAPGEALIVDMDGNPHMERILPEGDNRRCSFERIYFSRGTDADIYRERKALGARLVKPVVEMLGGDTDHAVFSFIPNTAEIAFFGMAEGLENWLNRHKMQQISELSASGRLTDDTLREILSKRIRIEKAVTKDVKMRTFIAEGTSRDDMAAHVYDVTYGSVVPDVDTLVVIDDSIVRGTTLRQSILRMCDRLHPRRIIVLSSSPQVRYPDYYGIDMSSLGQFIAFHAAVKLLRDTGRADIIEETYRRCVAQRELPVEERVNCVKAIYAPFTDREISRAIVELLTDDPAHPLHAQVDILYQSLVDMHRAIPGCPGDWYFSGDYPTPGGNRLVNEAFITWHDSLR